MLEAAGVVFDKIKTGNTHTKFKYKYTDGALMLPTCHVSLVVCRWPHQVLRCQVHRDNAKHRRPAGNKA